MKKTLFVCFNDGTEHEVEDVEDVELRGDNEEAILVLGPGRRPRAFFDLRVAKCWYLLNETENE